MTLDIQGAPYVYYAFGLNIASDIVCPGLIPARAVPDVTIRFGDVPAALDHPTACGIGYQVNHHEFLLDVKLIGVRYWVRNGREIIVRSIPRTSEEAIRDFLLGTCMAALLSQRGLVVLHGNTIHTVRGAVGFAGHSGAGKSTLTAAFVGRGYATLADDLCVLAFDKANTPQVLPGYPYLKLWADMLEKLGKDKTQLRHVRPELEKYYLPLDDAFHQDVVPLHVVYLLEITNEETIGIEPVTGLGKLTALKQYLYLPRIVPEMCLSPTIFRQHIAIAGYTSVRRVTRPLLRCDLEELVAVIEGDWA